MRYGLLTSGIVTAASRAQSTSLLGKKFKLFEVQKNAVGNSFKVVDTLLGVTVFTGTHKAVNDWLKARKLL